MGKEPISREEAHTHELVGFMAANKEYHGLLTSYADDIDYVFLSHCIGSGVHDLCAADVLDFDLMRYFFSNTLTERMKGFGDPDWVMSTYGIYVNALHKIEPVVAPFRTQGSNPTVMSAAWGFLALQELHQYFVKAGIEYKSLLRELPGVKLNIIPKECKSNRTDYPTLVELEKRLTP